MTVFFVKNRLQLICICNLEIFNNKNGKYRI